jgi:tetratricopeptide (TPR) repeat protein
MRRLLKLLRARSEQLPLQRRVAALLLVGVLTGGLLACNSPSPPPAPPRATPEELLLWSELSKSGRDHLLFGRYEEAEEDFEAALEISRSYRPSDVRRRSSIGNLRQLAVAYWSARRPQDFVRVMEHLLQDCREVPASQTAAMADALLLLGSVSRQDGKLTVSREALELSLAIRIETVGERDIDVGRVHRELGLTWIEVGDLDRAETEIVTATDIAAEDVGREHPRFANMLTAVSQLREAQGRTDDAEAELQRSVEIVRAAAGPSHRATVSSMTQLAQFYQRNDRLADAETTLEAIVTVYREAEEDGPSHIQSMNSLARFYIETGQPAKAEAEARKALAIFERRNAVGPLKAVVLDTLATSLQQQKRVLESEKSYLEAIANCRRKDGTPADQFDEIAGHYAELLRQLGRDSEAEGLPEKLRESLSNTGRSEAPPGAESEAAGAEVEAEAEPGAKVDAEAEVEAENGGSSD